MTQPKIDHLEAVRPDSVIQTTIDGVSLWSFLLRAGDVQSWDAANIGPSGKPNQRAELSLAAAPSAAKATSPYNVRATTGKQTYDVDYRFKVGWPTDHRWAMITQFHPQDDNPSGFKGFTGVSVHGNEITLEEPPNAGTYFAREVIKPDTWYRRRLVVNWSAKADGYVKWVNRDTNALLGRYNGPTIAAGEYKYLKQGYYRDGGTTQEGTVYETLMDIAPGDASDTSPVILPAPTPAPAPATGWSHGDEAKVLLIEQLPTLETLIGVITKMRDDVKRLLDKGL